MIYIIVKDTYAVTFWIAAIIIAVLDSNLAIAQFFQVFL
jgi:hypothetical protein